jgi:hypothetical protein
MLRALTVAALGLATTNAFLLVPEIADEAIDSLKAIKALPFDKISIAETQKIDLACPQCPLYVTDREGNVKLQADWKSHLELNFAIDHQAAGDRLLLNDFELYPNADPFSHMLAAELKANCKKKHRKSVLDDVFETIDEVYKEEFKGKKYHKEEASNAAVPLGFSMLVNPTVKSQDDDMELIGIDFKVIEVMNTFLDGIPSIHIELIKAPEQALMIGSVKVLSAEESAPKPEVAQAKCDTLLCKWGALLDDMFAKIKPLNFKACGGKGKHAPAKTEEGDAPKMDRPHHHHHHHPGHRVHKHSWGQLFKNIVSHVLLPILVGIVAGVSVSLIGMMVGTCIIAVWRTFFRRNHHRHHHHVGHAHHRDVQKEAALEEEKTGLMAESEAPPAYEDGTVKQ